MNDTEHNQEFKVDGEDLLKKVKEIIKAGNARKIIIKNETEETIVEIPLTVGAIGAVFAAPLVIVGAIAALVSKCTIIVVRK